MSENKTKNSKKNFLGSLFKIKSGTALDDIEAKDDVVLKRNKGIKRKVFILIILFIIGFVVSAVIKTVSLNDESNKEYAASQERKLVEIKSDNFAIWQAQATEKMNNTDKSIKETNKKLEGVSDFLSKDLPQILKSGFDKVATNIDKLSSENKDFQDRVNKRFDNISLQTDEKLDSLKKEIGSDFDNKLANLDKKIDNVKFQSSEVKSSSSNNLPPLEPNATTLPKPKEIKTETKNFKVSFKVSPADPKPEEEPEEVEATFNVYAGLAEGILLNGVNAAVVNGGTQEDSPVYISLLTQMSIANGEYTNVKDCLLIGGAVGEFATETAKIRLTKISCVFANKLGEKFVAEGSVKGWVTDENSRIGLKGQLITQEGKIIRASIPLALLQTGFDYITRKATNVTVAGGYGDLQAALGTGSVSAGSQTLSKMTDIYTQYLDSLTAVVSIMGGRKVTVLFNGGEKINLEPYKNKQDVEIGEMGISMGDDKYDYTQAQRVYYDEN